MKQVGLMRNMLRKSTFNTCVRTCPLIVKSSHSFNRSFFTVNAPHYQQVTTTNPQHLSSLIQHAESKYEYELAANSGQKVKLDQMRLDLLELYLKANQLEKAEEMLQTHLLPSYQAVFGEVHLQVCKLLYQLAQIQFLNQKPPQSLSNLYEVVKIKESAAQSGVATAAKQVTEATLAFNYVSFFVDYFQDIHLSESEKTKLFNVYLGASRKKGESTVLPQFETFHSLALQFPERSRFKLANTILSGKIEKVTKHIDTSLQANPQLYHLKYVFLTKLASLYEREMRYNKSYQTHAQALELATKHIGADSIECYETMVEMSSLLAKMGTNDEECTALAKKAIIGLKQKAPKDTLAEQPHLELKIAKALAALAESKIEFHPKEAVRLASQASKIYERIDGKQSHGWITTAYIFAEAYDNLAESDPNAMPLATRMYDEVEETIRGCETPSLLRLPMKSTPEFEELLGEQIIDLAARTYFPSPIATHYINVACRYIAFYMDAKTAAGYMEKALEILDEEQNDNYFCFEREFAATQLASFYTILKQDAKVEKMKSLVMGRLKMVFGTDHPFYKDQERHFSSLKSMRESSGETLQERLTRMEELMHNPEFEQKMQSVIARMEERAAEFSNETDKETLKQKELEKLADERLKEVLTDKKKVDEVMGFEVPTKDFYPIGTKPSDTPEKRKSSKGKKN